METKKAGALTPVMLYDGDCGFCQYWVKRWRIITKDAIRYFPYQEALERYPQVTEEACKNAVQLIMPDGKVFSGAHAVFHTFELAQKYRWLLWLYEYVPFFGRISEIIYQWIAHNRKRLSYLFRRPSTCRL